jgi:hypothetical protein
VGLFGFLSNTLPGSVDGDGSLNLDYLEGMANESGLETDVSSVGGSVNTHDVYIPDSLARMIEESLG